MTGKERQPSSSKETHTWILFFDFVYGMENEMLLHEFKELTGATNRQIDVWGTRGLPIYEKRKYHGSGYRKHYYPTAVPRVKMLVNVSKSFGGNVPFEVLNLLFYAYESGEYEFPDGLILKWPVE